MNDARLERDRAASESRSAVLTRRNVLLTSAWAAPTIAVASSAPAFAASGDAIVISNNGTARTSDEAGNVPAVSTYWNLKFNVTLPVGTFVTGLTATITCTNGSTNGLQHKGAYTSPSNALGSRGAFVFNSGLYSNETSGLSLSAPAPDVGGTTSEPGYASWTYVIPDALLVAGTTVPLQFTFKGIGGTDVPINVVFNKSTTSPGGLTGANYVCSNASTGALAAP